LSCKEVLPPGTADTRRCCPGSGSVQYELIWSGCLPRSSSRLLRGTPGRNALNWQACLNFSTRLKSAPKNSIPTRSTPVRCNRNGLVWIAYEAVFQWSCAYLCGDAVECGAADVWLTGGAIVLRGALYPGVAGAEVLGAEYP